MIQKTNNIFPLNDPGLLTLARMTDIVLLKIHRRLIEDEI